MAEKSFELYLRQTGILNILSKALNECALNKPADPLIYIAHYLSLNSHEYDSQYVHNASFSNR